MVIGTICHLLNRRWEIRLLHTLREGNSCADFLAKAGARQQFAFHTVVTPPLKLEPLLLADALGTTFVRT